MNKYIFLRVATLKKQSNKITGKFFIKKLKFYF